MELGQQVLYLGKRERTLRFRVMDSIRTRSRVSGQVAQIRLYIFGPNGQETEGDGRQVNPSVLPSTCSKFWMCTTRLILVVGTSGAAMSDSNQIVHRPSRDILCNIIESTLSQS